MWGRHGMRVHVLVWGAPPRDCRTAAAVYQSALQPPCNFLSNAELTIAHCNDLFASGSPLSTIAMLRCVSVRSAAAHAAATHAAATAAAAVWVDVSMLTTVETAMQEGLHR